MIGEIIGQEISVNVSKNMKAQVIPQGNSYQATREGYNLLNKSKVSLFNENKYIQGTVDLKSNTNYTIYFNKIPTDVSWKFEDESTVSLTSVNSNIKTFESGTHTSLSFYFGQDEIFSSVEEFLNTVQLMVLEGLYTADTIPKYEEYGAMPSLDYPSEVQAVGDNINLYPYENIPFQSDTTTESWCYVDGKIKAYGNTVTDGTDYKINLEKGEYYFKLETDDSNIVAGGLVANGSSAEKQLTSFDNAFEITETTVCTLRLKVANPSLGINIKSIKLEKGTVSTSYSPYGQGSVEIIKSNKNLINNLPSTTTINGITFTNNGDGTITINGTATSVAYIVLKTLTLEDIDYSISGCPQGGSNETYSQYIFIPSTGGGLANDFGKGATFRNSNKPTVEVRLRIASGYKANNLIFRPQLEKGAATNFVENEVNTYTIPIQKPFYKIGDYVDNFIKQNNKWYEQHYIKELILTGEEEWSQSLLNSFPTFLLTIRTNMIKGKDGLCNYFKIYNSVWQLDLEGIEFYDIYLNDFKFRINLGSNSEITTLEAWKAKVQELYNAGTPIKVYYVLATPELIECTEEQTQILEQLNNLYLYEGINYLYSTDDLSPIFQFSYDKIVNDFKFYLSENGRLIFPKENISFLCSISESTIPVMPEALETSAIIAGRDGDVPLETTYGPMSFELVLYTEDNLTPDEKLQQEQFLTKFCNSIKNNTETFALELAQKFYKIKYNGVLDRENYPKYLRVVFPFKSSNSYAYDVKNNTIYGNNKFESKTIESCGFKCIIKGPALKPILSLNDYSIEYTNTILDGESLIIDTNNSTAILVSSDGTETNAMRYYNHQFPKILNGENELKILSGIDNPENVSISWYDLTL